MKYINKIITMQLCIHATENLSVKKLSEERKTVIFKIYDVAHSLDQVQYILQKLPVLLCQNEKYFNVSYHKHNNVIYPYITVCE